MPWCSLRVEKPNEVISPTMTVISRGVILVVCFSFYICYVQIFCAILYGIRQVFLQGHNSHCDMRRYSWRRVYVTTTAMNIPVYFVHFASKLQCTSAWRLQVRKKHPFSCINVACSWIFQSNLLICFMHEFWLQTRSQLLIWTLTAAPNYLLTAVSSMINRWGTHQELWPHVNEPASFFTAMVDVHPLKKLQLLVFFLHADL